MIEDISGFYRMYIAPVEIEATPESATERVQPLGRMDFLSGSGLAVLFLTYTVASAAFHLLATLFTCFQNHDYRTSLFQDVEELSTYLGAIPFGWIGALFPQTINESFLRIPANGLIRHL